MAEYSKLVATTWLNTFGLTVEEISTASERRADLKARDVDAEYLIEVKEKIDTGNHSHFSESPLTETHSVLIRSDEHKRLDRLDNILRDGQKQIVSTPEHERCFNLIWVHFDGPHADMAARRLLYTFYGIADLCARQQNAPGINCLYFDFNAAFAMPNINAVVVCEKRELQIAINEFATNVDSFRRTAFVQKFGNAKYDPLDFENDESKIVLRSNIPRKNENDVLAEVKRQTGVDYYRVTLNRYTFESGTEVRR
jgi:hypothetical protein